MSEHTLAVFLAELILLLLAGRLIGEIMSRLGQPSIFGQLLAGVLLGPSVFGVLAPDWQKAIFPNTPESKSMLDAVSQIGILLLLLLTGMEANLRLINRRRCAVVSTSLSGIAVPFVCGVALAYAMPSAAEPTGTARLVTALFLGTALSISSVKIVAMVLMEVDAIRRDLGQLILATAILDDTLAWVIIAVIAGIASKARVDLASVGMILAVTTAFLALSFTIGRRLVAGLIRWSNDTLTIEVPVITTILVVMLAMALTTEAIGVHTALGAFVAGLMIGQSPILTEHIEGELRGLIVAFFSPVFFALAGLGMDVRTLLKPSLLLMTLLVIMVASVGKFGGALIGGRLGGLSSRESVALATGLNARGSTEVIVASLGLSMGAFTEELYTMVVAMAIVTTMMMPPLLRWALARVPLRHEEARRLEKEEAEEHESIPKIERALVVVDKSANGTMVAHLAGLFAASRQVVTTVIAHEDHIKSAHASVEDAITAVRARLPAATDSEEGNDAPLALSDLVQPKTLEIAHPAGLAARKEAEKGYGIIFVGIEGPLQSGASQFDSEVRNLSDDFDGPLAIALNGQLFRLRDHGRANILVPTGGKPEARLATELALALTKAADGVLTTLHIYDRRNDDDRFSISGPRSGHSVLEEARRLGERNGVIVKGITAVNSRAEVGILGAAQSGDYDLVVIGTALRQVSEKLLGSRTAMLLRTLRKPILLVTR